MKIGNKMFFSFGTATFIIFLLIGILIYQYVKIKVVSIQETNLQALSDVINRNMEGILNVSVKNYLRTFSDKGGKIADYYYNQYRKGILTEAEAIKELRNILLYPGFMKVGDTGYIAGVKKDGTLFIHPLSEGVNISGKPFWQKVDAIIKTPSQEGYIEYDWKNVNDTQARTKAAYITYFKPWDLILWCSSYKSEFTSLLNKADFRDDLLITKNGKTGFTYVLDVEGNAIIHQEQEGANLIENDYIETICRTKSGRIEFVKKSTNDTKERKYIAYYSYIKELDWIIVTGISQAELLGPLVIMRLIIIIGIILSSIILNVISSFISRIISSKIARFGHVFDIAEKGDFTQKYISVSVHSFRDEIDDMGTSLNSFLTSYKEVLFNLKKITKKVVELIQALSSSSQETSSTASQQAAAVKEIVSTMEDVDSLSKSIEKKISEITTITTNTQVTVKNGFSKVQDNLSKMEEINLSNKTTIDGIKFLSERIDNIWDIVNIINSIADQTKIITFNAELEASAAGEAGKNFQIVATEIRRLADSTVTSTNEIKNRITEIQKSSDRLILTSEEGTERIKEGNGLTKEINNLFADILSSSEISTDSTKQIAKSINQQVGTFEQILIAIKQISEGVDNIAIATREMTNASDDLDVVSETLESIVNKYKLEG